MKQAKDFKKSSIENNIHHWPIHDCSICGYECGYLFDFGGYEVIYDSGCYCTHRYVKEQRTWEDVAEHYNMQKNTDVIKKMNEYWRFSE